MITYPGQARLGRSVLEDLKSTDYTKPIDIESERATWQLIQAKMSAMLAAFPTTVQEDLQALDPAAPPLTFNQRNCILLRKGDKMILTYFINTSQNLINTLNIKKSDLITHIKTNLDGFGNARGYVVKQLIPMIE